MKRLSLPMPERSDFSPRSAAGPLRTAIFGTATIAFATVLMWIVLAANSGNADRFYAMLRCIPCGDKLFHLLASGTLAWLINATLHWKRVRLGPVNLLLGSVVLLPCVTVEEFSQLCLQHRIFSLADLTFDYLGILTCGLLAAIVTHCQRVLRRSAAASRVFGNLGAGCVTPPHRQLDAG